MESRANRTKIWSWTLPGIAAEVGVDEIRERIPAQVASQLLAVGSELPAVLLAAYAKVLSIVSAERSLLTGCIPPDSPAQVPESRGVEVGRGSWRQLIKAAQNSADAESPDAAARPEFDAVLDLSSLGSAALPASAEGAGLHGALLDVAFQRDDDGLTLCVRYRRELMDREHAARFAGYQLRALELLAADPDRDHDAVTLISEEEVQYQLRVHSGEEIPLPEQLFVELFEDQVRLRGTEIAASHGEQQWSYRELNERANRIAHALLSRGLRAEDPVAVVMDRELDWVAAMLGVFKAGGVYLPVRPDFPAERVATQLDRAGCRFTLTAAGGLETAREALATLDRECLLLEVERIERDEQRSENPETTIEPGQLAYIYFTSGSTGAPKGAMCEHAGMLNHLYMKIDDMRVGHGDVVTQTASQCFDISLWQVIAPLLVGGSTRIMDTDVQLDVDSFLDEIEAGGIHVIQVVPAYLDVMMTHLAQRHRDLGDLRAISVTGEALKMELVRRWFALYPSINLVNAYGATEVSDDTMHEVLTGVPERDFVSVGRSLRNVRTYVLDEDLRLAPLGAPGEIAFAGVCVGRGYINDEERTAQAFVEDPYRPGERMYRTGDFGRWLPEGRIEFLGRRDEQIKIRGYRVEIGEIENKMLSHPDVREAAVVVDGASEQNKRLVAFWNGPSSLTAESVRDHLATLLPEYMIPTYFHRLDPLPLTENGKVNKKMLTSLAGTLGHGGASYVAPVTESERRLATAWAEVLGVPLERIGRRDDFFELGGTSLAAVRLVVKLDRVVSLKQVVEHPVLEDLATWADNQVGTSGEQAATEPALLQQLSTQDSRSVATLICLPYAGGNAVNFHHLAKALEGKGIVVQAVELPGHDFGGEEHALRDVPEIAKAVHGEIEANITGPVMLWGHCAGAAFAVEIARLMEAAGRPPARIFAGALLLDTVDDLLDEIEQVKKLSNWEITATLRQDSAYVELDSLGPERARVVGLAYRHDVRTTNEYLIDAQQPSSNARVQTPMEVVVATDDSSTAGYEQRFAQWKIVADSVNLRELDGGGHYFVRTRAEEVADIVAGGLVS